MFTVFTNKDFLEKVIIDESPKNWYNILMSGYVDEVRLSEEIEEYEVDAMGTTDIIGNLQLIQTTFKTDTEYINDIQSNNRRVLENPNAVFLLDIETEKAEKIQKQYGVICQSIDSINDEILTRAYEYDLSKDQEGVDWSVYFNNTNQYLPSNALIICDRYMFSADSNSGPKTAQRAVDLGLANVKCIMNSVLPKKHNDVYNILIVFDSTTLSNENQMFESIVADLKNFAKGYKRSRHYKLKIDLISVDHDCANYSELHNRRIISNYFVVRADHRLRAFDQNKSTTTQTIFFDALFSKIVDREKPGQSSPIKSQVHTVHSLQELINIGNCRKYASIEEKQDNTQVTSNCKSCNNRLVIKK